MGTFLLFNCVFNINSYGFEFLRILSNLFANFEQQLCFESYIAHFKRFCRDFSFSICLLIIILNVFVEDSLCFHFYDEGPYHIETISLICRANQLTGFYMIEKTEKKTNGINKILEKNKIEIRNCQLFLETSLRKNKALNSDKNKNIDRY